MINLLLVQYKSLVNRFENMTLLGKVKTYGILFVSFLFLSWLYWGAYRLFFYLNAVEIIGPLLVNKLIVLMMIASLSMVIFSSLITSFNTFYMSKDLKWLMSTPLPEKQIFVYKTVITTFYSSWMVFVALFPFLLALGVVKHAGPAFYSGAFVVLVPFFALASMAGITVSIFLMKLFPSRNTKDIMLFLGVFVLGALYILFRFTEPEKLVRPDGMEVVAQYLAFLDAPVAVYLPSWWAAATMFGLISGNIQSVILYYVILFGASAAMMFFLVLIAHRIYYSGWAEGQVFDNSKISGKRFYKARDFYQTLFSKDFTTFIRDAGQWSQLMILGAIVTIYLFSLYKLPLDSIYLQNLVSFVNIGLISFVLAAVALRLVFPLVSLEGSSIWLIFSAPVDRTKVYAEKLIFGGIPVFVLAIVLVVISNLILKTDTFIYYLTSIAVLLLSIGLVFMAMSFGAVFPKFNTANVAEIESSLGGIVFMVTSLFYVAFSMSLWAIPVHSYYTGKLYGGYVTDLWTILPIAGLVILNLVVFTASFTIGARYFNKIEI